VSIETVSIELETANPVRSFKARGTEVVASPLADTGSPAVVCASAGNLGQALAWSGRGRGLDLTVVASRFASAAKLDRIRALDARLELVDGDFDLARERAAALARSNGMRLLLDYAGLVVEPSAALGIAAILEDPIASPVDTWSPSCAAATSTSTPITAGSARIPSTDSDNCSRKAHT
jgi:threonine dehydratase